MKVIGVVGLPGSGKGEVSKIAGKMGIPVVVMGDVIRERVRAAGRDPTDTNLGEVSRSLRAELGMDAIARLTIPAIESQESPIVLVDGIRGDYEVATFRQRFSEFVLVGITAPFAVRLARLARRGRADDMLTEDDLRARDERELGWGLLRALREADYTVENAGSVEDLAAEVEGLFARLGGDA
ncbi:flagellar hook-basal body complex protein FliE [Methanoculleus sp. FWC-SCC1]|uniref:Flagellar hook-basal body complex protein FliE n=1 Tax=Methanoculleus frigidifontis TaxID=2584085 RepID=A0ABT8M926_9EURY|nr:AAA family ATPase [Methanoculleus sp. FWC-SCC1]MDN7024433.1 flagellar hook-basal body complex protein FliE [Methanoculleus sp. FWC-SCC1]